MAIRDRWIHIDTKVQALAVLPAVVAVAATSAILVRLSDAPSTVKVTYRLVFASLGFGPASAILYRDELRRFGRRDVLLAGVVGVALAVHYVIWFESLNWTTVAAATTLVQTQTIFVAILAYLLFDESITRRMVLGIGFGFVGVTIMSMGGLVKASLLRGTAPVYGNALATSAGLLFAGYLVASRSVRQRVSTIPYLAVIHAFAAVTAVVLMIGDGVPVALTAYPLREWALFFAMGIGPSIVAQALSIWTLKYVASSVVSVAFLGVPVVSSLYALALFTEIPGPATVLGGALVLVGIIVTVKE